MIGPEAQHLFKLPWRAAARLWGARRNANRRACRQAPTPLCPILWLVLRRFLCSAAASARPHASGARCCAIMPPPPHTHARKHSQTHALAASAGSHRARFTLCAGSRARSSPHATLNRVLLNSHPFIATHTPSPLFISKLGSPAMQGDLSTLALPAPSHPPQPIYVCLKAQRRSPYPLPAPVGDRLQKTPAKSGVCQSSMQTGQPPSQCTAAARPRPNTQTRRLVLLFPPLHTVDLCDCGAGWRPPAGASRPSRTLCRPKIRIRRISNGGTDSRMLFDATPSPRLLQLPSWLHAMPRIHPT